MHESADVPTREGNIECFDKILLSESRAPRWSVVTCSLRRLMKNSGELVKLVATVFRGTTGTRNIAERGLIVAKT